MFDPLKMTPEEIGDVAREIRRRMKERFGRARADEWFEFDAVVASAFALESYRVIAELAAKDMNQDRKDLN